ncbi:MAG: DMT family transporter [Negativicutes bacterium]|nr:DMT family transporter [Negativicutes bacterium]
MGNWYGYLLVLAGAAIFGASSVIIKYTYTTGLSPVPVLVMQGLISSTLVWVWVLFSGRKANIAAAMLPAMVAQGAIGGFLTSLLFFSALESLGAALSTLLLFTYPAFVVVYQVLFARRLIARYEWAALVMALIGLIFCSDIFSLELGSVMAGAVLMALGSAVTNAFLTINGERLLAVYDTPVVTAWSMTFSTLMLLIVYQPTWLLTASLSWQQLLLVATGAVAFLLPLMLYLAGIKRIGAGIASIVSTAEIPLTLLLAWIFLGELLTGLQVFGGILIMASIVILYAHRRE